MDLDRNTTPRMMHAIVHRHILLKRHCRELRLPLELARCLQLHLTGTIRLTHSFMEHLGFVTFVLHEIQFTLQHVGHLWYGLIPDYTGSFPPMLCFSPAPSFTLPNPASLSLSAFSRTLRQSPPTLAWGCDAPCRVHHGSSTDVLTARSQASSRASGIRV